jgi:hypothetical protein
VVVDLARARAARQAPGLVDGEERARLEALRAEVAALEREIEQTPAWRRFVSAIVSLPAERARADHLEKLQNELREQEILVRELSYLLPLDWLPQKIAEVQLKRMRANVDDKKTIAEYADALRQFNDSIASGFTEVSMHVGLEHVIARDQVPVLPERRREYRKALERRIELTGNTPTGKVARKWAEIGLKLLEAYEQAHAPEEKEKKVEQAAA